jgi:O-antigen ligase
MDATMLRRSHFFLAMFLIASILCFNVAWHVANGFYTGWKRLGDPKSAFSFLPMLIAAGVVLHVIPTTKKWLGIWTILCVLILLSGERKAFVTFCLLTVVMYVRPSGLAGPIIGAGLITLAAGPLDAATGGYISKQIGSILADPNPRNEIWYTLEGGIPASMSDTARQFSARIAWDLFAQNPLFGAGPDGTTLYHRVQLANYPEFLQVAVHNEFLRILAEYGLFGLLFFLLPITRSVVLCLYDAMVFYRRFNSGAYLRLVLIIFIPSLIYMWSEGSGIEMFALVVIIAVLPDVLPSIAARSLTAGPTGYREAKRVRLADRYQEA